MSKGERSTPALEPTVLFNSSETTPTTATDAAGAALPDPLIGKRLKHFEIERLIGRGGMGSVYLGRDTALDRPVAVKVLAPEIGHDPEIVARFEREARAQARLRHPNVAQIYFIGEEGHLHFFVMEHVEGPALNVLLEGGRRVPWTEAVGHVLAAARGLKAAHQQGFIHRDVKPSNLIIDREAGIKLCDFGLVKSLRADVELTREGAIVGSPLYMAPEQGRGESVDHRTDIYALGCALYHMVTGRPPFSGPSDVAVIAAHITNEAAPVRTLAPDVPEAVERLIDRMMAKPMAARFATYDELIAALERARPDNRHLLSFRARALALAVDCAPLLVLAAIAGAWAAPVAAAYFVLCHRIFGRTLGKWLLSLQVSDRDGQRLGWKQALLRFLVFAWGPLAWTALGLLIYFVHRQDRVAFELARLTWSKAGLPLVYASIALLVFVLYLCGFLMAAFHPDGHALHDLVVRTTVGYRQGPRGWLGRLMGGVRGGPR
jgi:uncharacterized RDD family membrane protein YckC